MLDRSRICLQECCRGYESPSSILGRRTAPPLMTSLEPTEFSRAFALYQNGSFHAGMAATRALLGLQPDGGQAAHLHGLACYQLGRNLEADQWLRRVALLLERGDLVDALTNRGSVLLALGRLQDALACTRWALSLDPGKARALSVRAAVLRADLKPTASLVAARQAVALEPALTEAWTCVGNALQAASFATEAVGAYTRAIALAPDDIIAHGNRLFTLSFVVGTDDQRLFGAAREWGVRIERAWPASPPWRQQRRR